MICEASPQTHVRNFGKDVVGFALVLGSNVAIERTACNLGGTRAWFLCPECNRRCAILYPVKCRVCLGLHYRAEHKAPLDRQYLKAEKRRKRFGQRYGGIAARFPNKPKLMRWHTYLRERRKSQNIEQQIFDAYAVRIGKIKP